MSARICVVGSGWRFTSGISYYTCRLANALSARHDVGVVLMRALIPRVAYPGRRRVGRPVHRLAYDAAVEVVGEVDWWALPSLVRAVRRLRVERPELVVLQWWTGAVLHSYLALVLAARSVGARVVVELHEVQDTGEQRVPLAGRWLRVLGAAVLRRADAVVVHSEHDRAAVCDAFALEDVPVRVVPHGPFDHQAARTEPRPPDGCTRLLFFGTVRPYKGLEHLVEAFSSLTAAEAARFTLTVVGETWEGWDEPVRLARTGPHAHRTTVVNRYVTDEEVAAAFAAADAVVLPYTRSSASGPLHVAMAAGLPVVLTDVGGLRDAAGDYEGATWVPPADVGALRAALLALPDRTGRRYVDPRSWDDTVAVYEELLGVLCTSRS